jgi:hypothetical protein
VDDAADGDAVPANWGAAASAPGPSAERSLGPLAGAGSPGEPTDAALEVFWVVVVVRGAAVDLAVDAGGAALGAAVVVGADLVVGGAVALVVGGGQVWGRIGMHKPVGSDAPAGLGARRSRHALASAAATTASPKLRILPSLGISAPTLPWTCDRDQHHFAGPDRSRPRRGP